MSYSKKDILTSISFMLFILSFAIVFVVFFIAMNIYKKEELFLKSLRKKELKGAVSFIICKALKIRGTFLKIIYINSALIFYMR